MCGKGGIEVEEMGRSRGVGRRENIFTLCVGMRFALCAHTAQGTCRWFACGVLVTTTCGVHKTFCTTTDK